MVIGLVEVKKDWIFCDSSLVARKFGTKHIYVVRIIKKLITDIGDLRGISNHPKFEIEKRSYRGNNYEAYLMDRRFFSLLSMRFKGKKALEWQIKFNDAFYLMETRLLQGSKNKSDMAWIGFRDQGKLTRKNETDTIKKFVEYATAQGSKSAKFYYKHITNASYKALGLMAQSKPKLRESMNIIEISELMLAERYAEGLLKKYMKTGMKYKDIYKFVRDDLITFSNNLRIE
jgi:Rha family phage regulatory protein